ncbi:MAG: YcaO-like family protein [Deltaproteobacteria bacterium]|nr:YcaO-like family protein [Deltaproteobacteria bacterium]
MPPRPLVLRDVFKHFVADVEKTVAPEETVQRVRQRLRTLDLDILAETRRIDSGRLDIPVYLSLCGRDARLAIGNRKQMGKGSTPAQAEASAVMELVERFSLFSFKQDPSGFTTSPMTAVSAEAIDPALLALSVDDASADVEPALEVLSGLPLRWAWAFDLGDGRWRRLPFDWFYAINAYNGPAAGNCAEEAICQGICEVVERDVSARVLLQDEGPPAIDPASVVDPVCLELMDKYRRAGVQLHLSDLSLDSGVPTVAVLAWDPATFPARSEIVWTAGTATSPQRALSRTLTEVAQLAGDFDSGANFEASGLPKFTRLDQADFVRHSPLTRRLEDLPDLSGPNLREEIQRLAAALARRGMPVLLVDITHRQLQVPAFYTIVPGARFRERTASASVAMITAKLIAETRPLDEALARLEDFDRRLPDRYFIQFYLGTGRLAAGNPEAALGYLKRALDLDPPPPERASILVYLASGLKETGRWDEALDVLLKARDLEPDRTDIHNLLGVCHFKRGEHEAAIACFQQVLALDPGSAMDHANLGVNYQAIGDDERAAAAYEAALSLDPTIDFALKNLLELHAKESMKYPPTDADKRGQ